MYAGWRGRTLVSLITTVFVAIVGNLSGNAENLSGKTKFCRENQSIHRETAIDSPVAQLTIPLLWPERTTILPEREANVLIAVHFYPSFFNL